MTMPAELYEGCRSVVVDLDDREHAIVQSLANGPKRFNELRKELNLHQEILSRKLKALQRYCIVKYHAGYYFLCKHAFTKLRRLRSI